MWVTRLICYFLLGLVIFIVLMFGFRHQNRRLYQVTAVLQKMISSAPEPAHPLGTYSSHKQAIAQRQQHLRKQYQQTKTAHKRKIMLDSAGKYLSQAIVHELIPYWYGTQWSFEGHTETPQQGEIACGYFVSTVLNHAGFHLNRYKMAQQSPLPEVLTIHQQPTPIIFQAETAEAFCDSVQTHLPEGLYIFGLTNHMGFLWSHAQEVYLIHSGYIFPARKVLIEKATQSPLLYNPVECRLGAISTNPILIHQWLMGISVAVKK